MIQIPGGDFLYGSSSKKLSLPTFYIDQFEITVSTYKRCPSCSQAPFQRRPQPSPHAPITDIDWHEARAFCRWAQKDLPTEPEWEKAARGPSGLPYPWGSERPSCSLANGPRCLRRLSDVGPSFRPLGKSPFGVFDLLGNAAEWTLGCRAGRGQSYSPSTLHRVFPHCDRDRVTRGGSFKSKPETLSTTYRRAFYKPLPDVGFRCVWAPYRYTSLPSEP